MGLRGRKHLDKLGNVYFVTTTVMNFDKIFSLGNQYCDIIISSLKHLISEHKVQLLAYVIMQHHIHLVKYFPQGESLIDFMRDFKKFTSTEIRKQLERDNKVHIIERLRMNAIKYPKQKFKLWMDRYDDLIITTEKTLHTKVDYIHMNPVKAGLVKNPEDWLYSSARNYILNDNSIIEVNPI